MAQKEFTLQCRVVHDDERVFVSVKDLMIRLCRELNANLLMLSGGGSNKPDIKLFSDDFIAGESEIDAKHAKLEGDDPTTDDGTEEDKVL